MISPRAYKFRKLRIQEPFLLFKNLFKPALDSEFYFLESMNISQFLLSYMSLLFI